MKQFTQLLCLFLPSLVCANYWETRDDILNAESSQLIGSSINLTDKEQQVNNILMKYKLQEIDEGLENPGRFLASSHFFKVKKKIEASEVFKIIKLLPKGASLHSHLSAMLSTDVLLNLTYVDNLYSCNLNGTMSLNFFFKEPDDLCSWQLLSDSRVSDSNFDTKLKNLLSLEVNNPESAYPDIDIVWKRFEEIFTFIDPLISYRPVFRQYLYEVFRQFHDDNVMYLEIRSSLGTTYDENGTYNNTSNLQLFLDVLSEFRQNYPDFLGFRIIYANNRNLDNKQLDTIIQEYLQIKNQFPQLIAGFDLVGQEDKGKHLWTFAEQLQELRNNSHFYFHAGETDWYGMTDENLIDAVLLNTSRIGHAFGVNKHPEVLKIVKERNIAIELNPLSNQVLKLVDDLRNHVGAYLMANNYPVVVSCDDPGFWGAAGLSYDWYMAFMAMTPRNGDLKILKQLALNSINYSSLEDSDKFDVLGLFDKKWNHFLNTILQIYAKTY